MRIEHTCNVCGVDCVERDAEAVRLKNGRPRNTDWTAALQRIDFLEKEFTETRAALAKEKERADGLERDGHDFCAVEVMHVEQERDTLREVIRTRDSQVATLCAEIDRLLPLRAECELLRAETVDRGAYESLKGNHRTQVSGGIHKDREIASLRATLTEREAEIERLKGGVDILRAQALDAMDHRDEVHKREQEARAALATARKEALEEVCCRLSEFPESLCDGSVIDAIRALASNTGRDT